MDEIQNPPGLPWQGLPKIPIAGAGALLLAGILGAVALGVAWADVDVPGTMPGAFGGGEFHYEGTYTAFTITFVGDEEAYSSGELDGARGIGLLRAGGPLLTVGMGLAFVALVLVALDLSVPDRYLDLVGAGTAGLGFLALLAAVIVLPMGIARSVEGSFGGGAAASWGAGLFLAIAAGVLCLAGTAALLFHRFRAGITGTATPGA